MARRRLVVIWFWKLRNNRNWVISSDKITCLAKIVSGCSCTRTSFWSSFCTTCRFDRIYTRKNLLRMQVKPLTYSMKGCYYEKCCKSGCREEAVLMSCSRLLWHDRRIHTVFTLTSFVHISSFAQRSHLEGITAMTVLFSITGFVQDIRWFFI